MTIEEKIMIAISSGLSFEEAEIIMSAVIKKLENALN